MSRHFFESDYKGTPVTVLLGYDQEHDGYFMVIEPTDAESHYDYLYTNLFEGDPFPRTLDRFIHVLNELGIFIPTEVIMEVAADGNAKINNKDVFHEINAGNHLRKVAC